MTRLKAEDIKDIGKQLEKYDMDLFQKTGYTIRGIACHAAGIPEQTFQSIAASVEVGVVPFQSGQGILEGFTTAVRDIVQHVGFKAFITKNTDVGGIAEAVERNAEVIMMADDRRFIALNLRSNRMSDNAEATGKGFVAGLDILCGGVEQKKVLIIGCGRVGRSAAAAALLRGAELAVIDSNPRLAQQLARDIYKARKKRIAVETDLNQALRDYHLIIDATNAAGIIDESVIDPGTYVAAPGMPLGVTPAAVTKLSRRLLHDPLQTGVAVMAADSVLSRSIEEWRVMLPYGSYIAQVTNAPQKAGDTKTSIIKKNPGPGKPLPVPGETNTGDAPTVPTPAKPLSIPMDTDTSDAPTVPSPGKSLPTPMEIDSSDAPTVPTPGKPPPNPKYDKHDKHDKNERTEQL